MFRPFIRRLLVGVAAVPVLSAAVPVAANTAAAASTVRVAGTAVVDTSCPPAPKTGYDGPFPPLRVSGDLDGCWYTHIDKSWDLGPPTGLYFEVGREIFVGSINGSKPGSFSTVYAFESRWDPDAATGRELSGQCQHPIVPGSGTKALTGITGYLAFVDIVTDTPTSYTYSGFVNMA